MFFVISGYLITTILIEDIENQRFSIVNFYERRARRILASTFLCNACMHSVCLDVDAAKSNERLFAKSCCSQSVCIKYLILARKWLLSMQLQKKNRCYIRGVLAVEEQYYVLFPIFLILAWRFGKNRVFWMIVVMAAISLLLSEWGWRNKATANFYLAPTRAWELFAGSIAAFIVQKQGVQKNNS